MFPPNRNYSLGIDGYCDRCKKWTAFGSDTNGEMLCPKCLRKEFEEAGETKDKTGGNNG